MAYRLVPLCGALKADQKRTISLYAVAIAALNGWNANAIESTPTPSRLSAHI